MDINLHRKIELASNITEAILRKWLTCGTSCLPTQAQNRQLAIAIGIAVAEASSMEGLVESFPTILLLIYLPERVQEKMRSEALEVAKNVICQTSL
jgi:hypothetical protein